MKKVKAMFIIGLAKEILLQELKKGSSISFNDITERSVEKAEYMADKIDYYFNIIGYLQEEKEMKK